MGHSTRSAIDCETLLVERLELYRKPLDKDRSQTCSLNSRRLADCLDHHGPRNDPTYCVEVEEYKSEAAAL